MMKKSLEGIVEDMEARGIGAIIWDLADAGFHYIPEIYMVDSKTGKQRTVRLTGLYAYNGHLYGIEEGRSGVKVDSYYTPGVDVRPVVVTLSEAKAREVLGHPEEDRGFTQQGTLEEWTAIADCYFEALNENEEE